MFRVSVFEAQFVEDKSECVIRCDAEVSEIREARQQRVSSHDGFKIYREAMLRNNKHIGATDNRRIKYACSDIC